VISNDMDEAIDAVINPGSSNDASAAEDKYRYTSDRLHREICIRLQCDPQFLGLF
jgi:hypothetical protein